MDRQSKDSGITKEQLNEFYERGGTITICPPGARTEDIEFKGGGFYGRKPKKNEEE